MSIDIKILNKVEVHIQHDDEEIINHMTQGWLKYLNQSMKYITETEWKIKFCAYFNKKDIL